ncbi:hypothetical protein M422DRAFT_218508, partial [Sphaerobolus stellatus SS14]
MLKTALQGVHSASISRTFRYLTRKNLSWSRPCTGQFRDTSSSIKEGILFLKTARSSAEGTEDVEDVGSLPHTLEKPCIRDIEQIWDSGAIPGSPTTVAEDQNDTTSQDIEDDSGVEDHDDSKAFNDLARIIFQAYTVPPAWSAYTMLLELDKRRRATGKRSGIPRPALHKLARLLGKQSPRTRGVFTSLLSVLTTLKSIGGTIMIWEWNILMDAAGKGWRKTSLEDYRSALSIFRDMVSTSEEPTTIIPRRLQVRKNPNRPVKPHIRPQVKPNIITFTILLSIAARTRSPGVLRHATSLLESSGLPPNQITRQALVPYYIRTNELHLIREIVVSAISAGMDITMVNAYIWAYACHGKLRVAMEIYDHLRRNISVEDGDLAKPERDINQEIVDKNPILSLPGFLEAANMPPDAITYTMLIQVFCYYGDLIGALTIFRDMITTSRVHPPEQLPPDSVQKTAYFQPTMTVYRAIFLGFARHTGGRRPPRPIGEDVDQVPLPEFAARLAASRSLENTPIPPPRVISFDTPWSLENLDRLFTRFLEMGWEDKN